MRAAEGQKPKENLQRGMIGSDRERRGGEKEPREATGRGRGDGREGGSRWERKRPKVRGEDRGETDRELQGGDDKERHRGATETKATGRGEGATDRASQPSRIVQQSTQATERVGEGRSSSEEERRSLEKRLRRHGAATNATWGRECIGRDLYPFRIHIPATCDPLFATPSSSVPVSVQLETRGYKQ